MQSESEEVMITVFHLLAEILNRGGSDFLIHNGFDDWTMQYCSLEVSYRVKSEAMIVACLLFSLASTTQKCKYVERQIAGLIELSLDIDNETLHSIASQALIELFGLGMCEGNESVILRAREIAANSELNEELAAMIFESEE
jgi:hypothetical protein